MEAKWKMKSWDDLYEFIGKALKVQQEKLGHAELSPDTFETQAAVLRRTGRVEALEAVRDSMEAREKVRGLEMLACQTLSEDLTEL